MGMHIGLIAARVPTPRLRGAVLEVWPEFEIVESENDLADAEALWAWIEAHEDRVPAQNRLCGRQSDHRG